MWVVRIAFFLLSRLPIAGLSTSQLLRRGGVPGRDVSSPLAGYKNNNTFFKHKKEGNKSTLANHHHNHHTIPRTPPPPLQV